ncbi:hypothetical protein UY3_13198 [Chelonia mydas]|uniref:Uncharacterized protein n=1 Tax=Chelonia mydas TaxID=8469 RepID=M7BNC1_CHEMY|nr:hypothetical protein UY3_13198 [Chelonia mydas]
MGKLTKEQLMAQLVENNQSEEQAPEPRVPGELGRSRGGGRSNNRESLRPNSPVSPGGPQSGFSLEELWRLELEAKEMEMEERRLMDCAEQQKHESELEERGAKRCCQGGSGGQVNITSSQSQTDHGSLESPTDPFAAA